MRETAPLQRARVRPLVSLVIIVIVAIGVVLAFAGYAQPVIMGIVQGLGEFLPISSSAHLILVPWFFGWTNGSISTLTFDVALHLGTLIALVVYFWRDWIDLMRAVPGYSIWAINAARGGNLPARPDEHILHMIFLATLPGALVGILLEKIAEESLRSPLLIAGALAIMGVLLYVADHQRPQLNSLKSIRWSDAALIGIAQACALIPGVSRSGATITMGRFLALDRASAARFSFLLSAPITTAAVLFKLDDILRIPRTEWPVFVVGVLVSGVIGALAIGFLLNYIRRAGFGIFAIYRLALALLVVVVYVVRGA